MMLHLAPRIAHTVVGTVAGILIAGGGYALARGGSGGTERVRTVVVTAERTVTTTVVRPTTRAQASSHIRVANIRTATGGVVYACVNNRTHVMTLRTSPKVRCAAGNTAMQWSVRGPAGAKGAAGKTGTTGAAGANATSTAWGEVWPEATGDEPTANAKLANGTSNVSVQGQAVTGSYWLYVGGCSTEGLLNPTVQVEANNDPEDTMDPFADAGMAATRMGAVVQTWQTVNGGEYSGDLAIEVATFDESTGDLVDLDFSFIVDC